MKRALLLNSLFFLGVVITYPGFFIFNPFAPGFTVLGLLQSVSTAGWIITICLPLISWVVDVTNAPKGLLAVSILIWPISLLMIRLFMGLLTGNFGFQYLFSTPVFFITDLISPILLAWWVLTDSRKTRRFRSSS